MQVYALVKVEMDNGLVPDAYPYVWKAIIMKF